MVEICTHILRMMASDAGKDSKENRSGASLIRKRTFS